MNKFSGIINEIKIKVVVVGGGVVGVSALYHLAKKAGQMLS